MNARRRPPRLFLDHKPPLVAFTVVAVACALMMVHMARSEAAPGWLRAGLGGLAGQRVIAATVLEHDPAAERATVAAAPLPVGVSSGSAEGAPPVAAGAGPVAGSSPAHGGHAHATGSVVGEVVGEVVGGALPGSGATPSGSDTVGPGEVPAGGPNVSADDEDTAGPGRGHGEARGHQSAPDAASNVPTPNVPATDDATSEQSESAEPRGHQDWRDDWVGDRGHGKGKHDGKHHGKHDGTHDGKGPGDGHGHGGDHGGHGHGGHGHQHRH